MLVSRSILSFLAGIVLIAGPIGCGEDSNITVRFEEAPGGPVVAKVPPRSDPVVASQTAPPVAPPPAVVSVTPVSPVPGKPAATAAPAVSSEKAKPGRVGHAVAVFFDGPFFPSLDVSMTPTATLTGAVVVHDRASRDGLGVEGKLSSLLPGEYQLKLTSPRLPGYPMHETTAVANGHDDTRIVLGWVQFFVAQKSAEEIGRGILLELVEDPSRRPVFRGPIGQMKTEDTEGKIHSMLLVLPPGSYVYALSDLDPADKVSIGPSGGRPGLIEMGGPNTFKLSKEHPSTIVDLRPVLTLK